MALVGVTTSRSCQPMILIKNKQGTQGMTLSTFQKWWAK